MSSPDDPQQQPVIVLRVVIRSPDLDTFIAKYSRFLKDDRIFIFTKASQPLGTRVRFTLELADGQPLIVGEGTVVRVRNESGDAAKPPGMELQFQPLDAPSRALVARMMKARESPQFRDESTDVQTQVRGGGPSTRDFDERPATLPPLAKTGAHESVSDALPLPPPRQDDTGAVTLAQEPGQHRPGFEAPDTKPSATFKLPSGSFASPLPMPSVSPSSGEHPSGGFATPTPLPPPNPPALEDSYHGGAPAAQLARLRMGKEPFEGAGFAGPAPAFAEAFREPALAPRGTPPTGAATLPANPFGNVPDNAIEYFVEWSLEHSTSPKPKLAEASFADVKMATPKAEKARPARASLLWGLAAGLVVGVPLGAIGLYVAAPSLLQRQVIVLEPPPTVRATTAAVADLGGATAQAEADPASAQRTPKPLAVDKPAVATPKAEPPSPPSAPPARAEAPAPHEAGSTRSPPPSAPPAGSEPAAPVVAKAEAARPASASARNEEDAADAALQLSSKPPGAQVTVDGVVRGKTPLSVNVAEGAHELKLDKERYATVTQSVQAPGKLDVTLKRPPATLHVDSDPPGGDVLVEGKPRGKTPVDVTLEAFHHYDVQVTLLGTHPFHKRVSLKPPQTDVMAKLPVVHAP